MPQAGDENKKVRTTRPVDPTAQANDALPCRVRPYDRLVEAAADIAAAMRFETRLPAEQEERLPSAMIDRSLAGHTLLRVWREHRWPSAGALAAKAGIAQPYLSQIETGTPEGTLKTIADALGVTLDDPV